MMLQRYKKNRNGITPSRLFYAFFHAPTQLAAPRAVTIAVAIDAIICKMNFTVSLFVMVSQFLNF
jgi:hypothetical protein